MSAQITSNFLASPLCSDLPPRLYFPEDTLAFTHTSKHKAKHYAFEADDEPDQLQDYERLEVCRYRSTAREGADGELG